MAYEEWRPIKDFENKYEVSNFGRIRNKKTNHIYKLTNQYGDYFAIVLYSENHRKSTRVHREVAKAFIPNPKKLPQVNHKDMNKQNNCVDNLEWVSGKENIHHAIKNNENILRGMENYNKNKAHKKYGYIYQFDKNMKFIKRFYDCNDASLKTGVCKRNILHCINHQEGRKQAGGFIWLKESEVVDNAL